MLFEQFYVVVDFGGVDYVGYVVLVVWVLLGDVFYYFWVEVVQVWNFVFVQWQEYIGFDLVFEEVQCWYYYVVVVVIGQQFGFDYFIVVEYIVGYFDFGFFFKVWNGVFGDVIVVVVDVQYFGVFLFVVVIGVEQGYGNVEGEDLQFYWIFYRLGVRWGNWLDW